MPDHRLYAPSPVAVRLDSGGRPSVVAGRRVERVLEEWLVEDRWWTGVPLRRHYLELLLDGGRDIVVFCDRRTGRWLSQRG